MVKVDIFLQEMPCRHGFPPYYYESPSESATTKKLHNLKQPHGLLRVNKPLPLMPQIYYDRHIFKAVENRRSDITCIHAVVIHTEKMHIYTTLPVAGYMSSAKTSITAPLSACKRKKKQKDTNSGRHATTSLPRHNPSSYSSLTCHENSQGHLSVLHRIQFFMSAARATRHEHSARRRTLQTTKKKDVLDRARFPPRACPHSTRLQQAFSNWVICPHS